GGWYGEPVLRDCASSNTVARLRGPALRGTICAESRVWTGSGAIGGVIHGGRERSTASRRPARTGRVAGALRHIRAERHPQAGDQFPSAAAVYGVSVHRRLRRAVDRAGGG